MGVKKKVVKKKPGMKATFDLLVYRQALPGCGDRVFVLPVDAAPSIEVSIENGTPVVTVSDTPDLENRLIREYCTDFMERSGCGELPKNQLIKWTITTSVMPKVDTKALQRQILEQALAKLK